jgi:arabinofuranosyltransferase
MKTDAIAPRGPLQISQLADRWRAWLPLVGFMALMGLVVARSWLCDDAYITLRTIDNLVHGLGARWNVADRVQTYTHPLWMMLLSVVYAVTREPYFTTLALGWLLTGAASAILVWRIAASPLAGAWASLALACDAAFCDYSTSGLENPLTHALLACFVLAAGAGELTASRVFRATLAASALCLSRPDAILLVAPSLAVLLYSTRRAHPCSRFASRFALGLLPLVLWAKFSVTYYGFLWPNTAYAKLGSGIPASELAWQGTRYLRESLRNDPLTLIVIVSALILTLRRSAAMERALAIGIALYLVWLVKLGGDFMSGRLLTAPFFVAVALIVRRNLGSRNLSIALLSGTLLCGALAPRATWRVHAAAGARPTIDAYGIANERDFYLPATGLAARLRSGPNIDHPARLDALELRRRGPALIRLSTLGCGLFGYYAGPDIHIVDEWALGDPLLARLPAARRLSWRIGHFGRAIPPGYLKTLASGRNQLRDPDLARYWDQLALVVRAPLFSVQRWRAIADFARGRTDQLIDRERYRLAELVVVDAASLGSVAAAAVTFGDGGLEVRLDRNMQAHRIELALEGGSSFSLRWYRAGKALASSVIELPQAAGTPLVVIDIPNAARSGAERVRVLPERGAGVYRLTRFHPITPNSAP